MPDVGEIEKELTSKFINDDAGINCDLLELDKSSQHRQSVHYSAKFTNSYFQQVYGVNAWWMILFVVSGLGTPLARVIRIALCNADCERDKMMIGDTCMAVLATLLCGNIWIATHRKIFKVMFDAAVERKNNLTYIWWKNMLKWSIRIFSVLGLVRPVIVWIFVKEPYSHIGGLFLVCTLPVAFGYAWTCYIIAVDSVQVLIDMVVAGVEKDQMKWRIILRKVQEFDGRFFRFWLQNGAAGPWGFFICICFTNCAVELINYLHNPQWDRVAAFFVSALVGLATLWPLALVTSKCNVLRREIKCWYCPDNQGMIVCKNGDLLAARDFDLEAYRQVLHYMDHTPLGARVFGIRISKGMVYGYAAKLLFYVPTGIRVLQSMLPNKSTTVGQTNTSSTVFA